MGSEIPIAVIAIGFHEHDGIYHAYSPQLPALHVCGKSKETVLEDIPGVVKVLYKLNNHLEVTVRPASSTEFKPLKIKKVEKLGDWIHFLAVPLQAIHEPA